MKKTMKCCAVLFLIAGALLCIAAWYAEHEQSKTPINGTLVRGINKAEKAVHQAVAKKNRGEHTVITKAAKGLRSAAEHIPSELDRALESL